MAVIKKSKRFSLEVEVNADPVASPPPVTAGTKILWNDGGTLKAYIMTETGVKKASDIGSGGGGGGGPGPFHYTMPTQLADGVGNAGKLMQSNAGEAEIAQIQPPQAGTKHSWDITINSLSVPNSSGTFAWANFEFAAQPVDGDTVRVQCGPDERTFEFTVDLPLNDINAVPVNIGPALDITLQNLAMQIENFLQAPDFVKAEAQDMNGDPLNPFTKVKVTAGDFFPGQQGNFECYLEIVFDGGGNISLSHEGGVGEFTGGVDGAAGTFFQLDDMGDGAMGWINAQIQAGNHWAIQADVNAEAAAIAVAMANNFTDGDINNYTAVAVANVITLTRGLTSGGDGAGDEPNMQDSGIWSGMLAEIVFNRGQSDQPSRSQGVYIGKLVSVVANVATIEINKVMEFTNDGVIANGGTVLASDDGKVRPYNEAEQGDQISTRLGLAIVGGADGATSKVILFEPAQTETFVNL